MSNRAIDPSCNGERTSSDEIAQRVLEACRKRDDGAAVTYVGRDDDGQTVVRVRSGADSSVAALQTALKNLFPFARVRTNENVLTGTLQAEILVPSSCDEWRFACDDAASNRFVRLLKGASFSLIIGAIVLYVKDATEGA